MRRPLVGLLAALLLVTTACSGDGDAAAPPGDSKVAVDTPELRQLRADAGIEPCVPGTASGKLPDVTLPCLGGGASVDLSTLQGPMVINLWNAPCGPCRIEMPILQELHARHGDRVQVLGIDSLDTLPGVALKLARERGATYPQLADPGGELQETTAFAKATGRPYLAFVDADGVIRGQTLGGVRSYDELAGLVDRYLDVDVS